MAQFLLCSSYMKMLILVFTLVWSLPLFASEPTFYTWDGRQLSPVYSQDDSQYSEWEIWLYYNGTPLNPAFRWGIISGQSQAAVTKKLKRFQSFEKRYAKWCGCGPSRLTYFNPSAPIAILRPKKPELAKYYERFNEVLEGYDKITDVFNQIATTSVKDKIFFNEYLDHLKQAYERVQKDLELMDHAVAPVLASLDADLASMTKESDYLNQNEARFELSQDDRAINSTFEQRWKSSVIVTGGGDYLSTDLYLTKDGKLRFQYLTGVFDQGFFKFLPSDMDPLAITPATTEGHNEFYSVRCKAAAGNCVAGPLGKTLESLVIPFSSSQARDEFIKFITQEKLKEEKRKRDTVCDPNEKLLESMDPTCTSWSPVQTTIKDGKRVCAGLAHCLQHEDKPVFRPKITFEHHFSN